jgi:hypothetical protein
MRQQHIRSRAERPNDKRTDWLHLADMCTRIVLNSRFVTRRMLARAYTCELSHVSCYPALTSQWRQILTRR